MPFCQRSPGLASRPASASWLARPDRHPCPRRRPSLASVKAGILLGSAIDSKASSRPRRNCGIWPILQLVQLLAAGVEMPRGVLASALSARTSPGSVSPDRRRWLRRGSPDRRGGTGRPGAGRNLEPLVLGIDAHALRDSACEPAVRFNRSTQPRRLRISLSRPSRNQKEKKE